VLDFKKYSRISGEAGWIAGGQFASVLGALVGVRMLTGYLEPRAYGELALWITLVTLSQQVVFAPLGNAVVRFFAPLRDSNALGVFFAAVRWFYLRAIISGAGLAVLGYFVADHWNPGSGSIAALATVYALVLGCGAALDCIQNAARQRAIVAFHGAMGQWLKFPLAVVAIYILHPRAGSAICGYAVAAIVILTSQTAFLRRTFHEDLKGKSGAVVSCLTEKMWRYAWPFAAWAPFTWFQLSADRWSLQHYVDTTHVGLYQAFYQIGYAPISLLTGFVVNLATPVLFDRAGDGTSADRLQLASRFNNIIVLLAVSLTAVAVVITWFLHADICKLLLASAYRSESHLLPWFVLSGGMFAAGQVLTLNSTLGMDTRALLHPKIGTAASGTALTFVLTRFMGMFGTVVAGALFSSGYFIWLVCLNRRSLKRDFSELVFSTTAVVRTRFS